MLKPIQIHTLSNSALQRLFAKAHEFDNCDAIIEIENEMISRCNFELLDSFLKIRYYS